MFIVVLFTIAKVQKQPKCSLMDEWIEKMECTVKYYSALKEILLFATIWMKLESIVLSQIGQPDTNKYCMDSFVGRL